MYDISGRMLKLREVFREFGKLPKLL